ncbi:MAG: DNA-directed DNA polymerase II small subunit [Euryarchaeota archaeon]|nr:DNA-directed DNA polymerase II small subunit [Euryarchaeota archaeon]
MQESLIVEEFANAGYQVSPDAVALIGAYSAPDTIVSKVLQSLDDSVLVVGREHINIGDVKIPEKPADKLAEKLADKLSKPADAPAVNILSDISNESTCVGEYSEFVRYFRDRYTRLSGIIRGRITARPIESLRARHSGREYDNVSIIGMVSDVRTTSNGNKLMEIEDPTGSFPVLVRPSDRDLWAIASGIIHDEVIGVTGSLTRDGRLMIVKSIVLPDLPNRYNQTLPGGGRGISGSEHGNGDSGVGCAALISDVHIGSDTFLGDAFSDFIDWLGNGSLPVQYLIIAGDLVDGIGIYPGQESELEIPDVYDQYRSAAEYLGRVPKNIRIIIAPGNHDAVRLAEPQPALPEKIRSMFSDDVIFTGNPALVEIRGVRILIYHGRSMDDLIATIPKMSYQRPELVMIEMLRRRHLAPMYGGRVSIAPENSDHFVIDRVPHILHCGHVHTIGIDRYKGVTVVNSGTWQSQTDFQKRMNLDPVPAHATIVDLATLGTKMVKFA